MVSLALFRPTKINRLVITDTSREWDREKVKALDQQAAQLSFFQSKDDREAMLRAVEKIPYKFSYEFVDDDGRESTLMI